MPDLALAVLFAALEGRRAGRSRRTIGLGRFGVEGGPEGPWLTRLPDALRDALAAASAEELRRLSAGLLGAAEPADGVFRAALRTDLVVLARMARAEDKGLYLWIGGR